MKRIIKCLLISLFFSSEITAQKDSLLLTLNSEYNDDDSAKSYIVRIDFISKKHIPINFYFRPLRPVICCWDFEEEIGVEIEKLDNNQFKPITNCADCHFYKLTYSDEDQKQLNYGDTISYKTDISLFDRVGKNGKAIGFKGKYRCRAYRYYLELEEKNKIFSDWLYISFSR